MNVVVQISSILINLLLITITKRGGLTASYCLEENPMSTELDAEAEDIFPPWEPEVDLELEGRGEGETR